MVYKLRNVQTNQAMPLPHGEIIVGREEGCNLLIENTSVSRRHARITNSDIGGVFIEDIGSANGTAVRNQLIKGKTALQLGDIVSFGTAAYRLDPEIGGQPLTKPTSAQQELKPVGLGKSLLNKATDRMAPNPPP